MLDAPGGVAPSPSPGVDITMGLQPNDNWCWAYVASAIARFFDPGSPWTPCALANEAFGNAAHVNCCTDYYSSICDKRFHLKDAMQNITGNLKQPIPGAIDVVQIRQELTNGAPLCVRIRFPGDPEDGGHDVIIRSVGQDLEGRDTVSILDPRLEGISWWPISELRNNYGIGGGRWVETYTTKPKSA
jgi:hypothetical protein